MRAAAASPFSDTAFSMSFIRYKFSHALGPFHAGGYNRRMKNDMINENGFKFRHNGEDGWVDALPGIRRKTMLWGEKTLLATFYLAAGSRIPEHTHPEEQTGYLVSGRLTFHAEGRSVPAAAGDSWVFPGGMPHAVDVHEDSVVVEVFAPVRQDYKN